MTLDPDVNRGFIDTVDGGYVRGWAVEGRPSAAAPSLFLFVDNTMVSNFRCDEPRPDLDSLGLNGTAAGFSVPIPEAFLDDADHQLCIRFSGGDYLMVSDGNGGFATTVTVRLDRVVSLSSHVDGLNNGSLRGWAVLQRSSHGRRNGGLDIVVKSADTTIATVKASVYRPDVGRAMDCDPHCGFKVIPPARFRDGRTHSFTFHEAQTGQPLHGSPVSFAFPVHLPETKLSRLFNAVEDLSAQLFRLKRELLDVLSSNVQTLDDYHSWATQYQPVLRQRVRAFAWPDAAPRPLVSVLCPVFRPRLGDVRAAIDSVLGQTWRDIELVLVDDRSDRPELTAVLQDYAARDSRVRLIVCDSNVGISGATNVAIAAATGDFIALFDHDDLLMDVAVEAMMQAALQTGARMLYSDEDKIDDFGRFSDPNLKSGWNYRLLLGQNYVCHFLVVDAATLRAAGPLRKKYDGAQDHDLILRLAEIVPAEQIAHVPEVIYHWRKTVGSTATTISAKSYAVKAGANAVRDHLKRRGFDARVSPMLGVTTYEVDWRFRQEPTVTVVIPFKDQAAITRRCLEALLGLTEYGAFDVILVDNWSSTDEAAALCAEVAADPRVTVLRIEEPFNYARLNNQACATSGSEFFVFMNNDVIVEQPAWLRRMVDEALADPAVGAVGAKLVFPDRTTQHAGVILGVGGVGDHAYRGRPVDDPFYVGRGICAQELSAVTAALMLCRAETFRTVGGFDERELAIAYNDVDLCLKLRRAGTKVILCPAVIAEHHESISRGDDMAGDRLGRFLYEQSVMLDRWPDELANDPFYNPNFSNAGGIFEQLSPEPLDPRRILPVRIRSLTAT